jgi:hypothetical protein
MSSARYTIVLTRGSVCTNESGRTAVLTAVRLKARDADVPIVDPYSGDQRTGTVDLLELITILEHDSGANPAVLKQLLGSPDDVISLSDYIARRSGLSSVT